MDYMWLKSLHVISVIAWMAGLFYLPRLFVYHTTVAIGSETSELFKVMERRLYIAIMMPAMVASYVTGIGLVMMMPAYFKDGWFHAKAGLVVLLTVFQFALAGYKNKFAQDDNQKSERFFRIINEAPTILMIGIVIMVIVKPI
ncbi:Protoporphyrinogen IX oxidase [uncultured Gammaproteobacteria bacterium]